MKKGFSARIASIALAMVLVFCSSCFVMAEETDKKVTVMVYLCGSSLEAENGMRIGQATQSISDMVASRFNTDDVNVVVMIGGATAWLSGYSTDELSILALDNRRPRIVDTMPLASMGEAETLTAFLDYCHDNYPAEHYDLIMWDHGGGPLYGVCQDMLFKGEMLDMHEMADALAGSSFGEKELDIIAYNACLMGSAEVAKVLAPYARYMVATEDSMYGMSYEWLSGVEKDETPLDTAIRIVDGTYALNKEIIELQNAPQINAVAAIDLAEVEELNSAVSAFFENVTGDLDKTTFTQMSGQRRDTAAFGFGDSGNVSDFDLVDLYDMVEHYRDLDPAGADAVRAAMDKAVIYKQVVKDTCYGLTVYHPYDNLSELESRIGVYNGLGFAEGYTAYLQAFSAILTDTPLAQWVDLITDTGSATKDNRTLFSLSLSSDQAEHYGDSDFYVLMKDDEDNYVFTFMTGSTSFDNASQSGRAALNEDTEDGNAQTDSSGDSGGSIGSFKGLSQMTMPQKASLTGEFNGTALYAADKDGNIETSPLEYQVGDDGLYRIPAEVIKHGEEGEEDVSLKAVIVCTLDKVSRKLRPGSVLIYEETMGGYTSAYNLTLEDFDEIVLTTRSRRETRDENGTLKAFSEWEEAGSEEWRAAVSDEWNFLMVNDSLDTTRLYATFQVSDSQNNVYSSEPLVVKAESAFEGEMRVAYDDASLVLINSFQAVPADGGLTLSGNLMNLQEAEAVIKVENIAVNGESVDASADVVGTGENWGLVSGEEQAFHVTLDGEALAGIDTVEAITFDLTLLDAVTEESLGSVPVEVTLNLALS